MYKQNVMRKSCGCGGIMTIHMHTLVYSAKIKITHVPVYTCRQCARYEPLPVIKRDLGKLLGELAGTRSRRQHLSFAKRNEWASVLKDTLAAGIFAGGLQELEETIQMAIQGRIDLLLDVYRAATDMSDTLWMDETELRLSQLTAEPAGNAK